MQKMEVYVYVVVDSEGLSFASDDWAKCRQWMAAKGNGVLSTANLTVVMPLPEAYELVVEVPEQVHGTVDAKLAPLTFEQFVGTREEGVDLYERLQDDQFLFKREHTKGNLYCKTLYIEDTATWPDGTPAKSRGKWYTLIGRSEYQSDNLAEIEHKLHDFAVSEEYTV